MYNHQEDRSSLSVSVEARNPFLDYRIVEYGLMLDSRDLLHRGLSKWVVREAMRDLLPSAIVDRHDKQGFTTDEAEWLRRGALGSEVEAVFRSRAFAERPYFQTDALLTMLAAHRSGRAHTADLWRAFIVERWLRMFVDPARFQPLPGPPPAVRAQDRVVRPEKGREAATAGLR
jgi:asparagine synthase (glutamine-hydrolysing)